MESNQDSSGFMNPKNEEDPEPIEVKGSSARLEGEGEEDPAVSPAQIDEESTYKRIEGLEGAGDDEPVERE